MELLTLKTYDICKHCKGLGVLEEAKCSQPNEANNISLRKEFKVKEASTAESNSRQEDTIQEMVTAKDNEDSNELVLGAEEAFERCKEYADRIVREKLSEETHENQSSEGRKSELAIMRFWISNEDVEEVGFTYVIETQEQSKNNSLVEVRKEEKEEIPIDEEVKTLDVVKLHPQVEVNRVATSTTLKCYFCHTKGHLFRDCGKWENVKRIRKENNRFGNRRGTLCYLCKRRGHKWAQCSRSKRVA